MQGGSKSDSISQPARQAASQGGREGGREDKHAKHAKHAKGPSPAASNKRREQEKSVVGAASVLSHLSDRCSHRPSRRKVGIDRRRERGLDIVARFSLEIWFVAVGFLFPKRTGDERTAQNSLAWG